MSRGSWGTPLPPGVCKIFKRERLRAEVPALSVSHKKSAQRQLGASCFFLLIVTLVSSLKG